MIKEAQTALRETKDVAVFFHGYAADFDSIYGHTKKRSTWDKLLDKYFRESMRIRFDLTIKNASNPSIQSVLDIGCGGGVYTEALLEKNKTVTGLDIAEGMLNLAKNKTSRFNSTGKVNYILSSYLDHHFNQKFDAAILTGFFDYIKTPLEIFQKLKQDVSKEIYMSFPKAGGFLGWQRKVRYGIRNCPLYYYTENDIKQLLHQMDWQEKATITSIKRDFFVKVVL